jgi:polysaccharide chain length determinant protein (PEP-CTERM system associated)
MVTQRELTIEDYIGILQRRWILIAILAVTGTALGLGIARILPKSYTSETVVLVEQPTVAKSYVDPIVNPDTNQRLATMQQEILSRSRLEPIIHKLSLYQTDIQTAPMDDVVARLRKAIDVTAVQPMARVNAAGLPGFTISVTFGEPALAQEICSTVTSMFLEENLRLRQHQAEQTTDFLTDTLDGAKAKLDEQDAKLAAFQRAHLGSLPDDQATNMNMLGGLATQLDAATQALARAQQDKNFAESSLAEQLAAWRATLNGANPETEQQQIVAMEAELATLKTKYTDDHPDVIRLKRNIANAKKAAEAAPKAGTSADAVAKATEPPAVKQLRDQIHQFEVEIQDRTAQQEEIREKITKYQARMEETPATAQEYKSLTRDYQAALEFYNNLSKNRQQADMASNLERRQESEQFRVLDPARFPDRPSFPKQINFLAGGFGGGLALGLGLTVLLEMRDTSVRTDRDVEALLHLPVLAVVPELKKPANNLKQNLALEVASKG